MGLGKNRLPEAAFPTLCSHMGSLVVPRAVTFFPASITATGEFTSKLCSLTVTSSYTRLLPSARNEPSVAELPAL